MDLNIGSEFVSEDMKLAVKKGVNWLDKNHPNWVFNIELDKLNMRDCVDCVIGQAVGYYASTVRDAAGVGSPMEWSVEHGFTLPWPTNDFEGETLEARWSQLETIWSEEVQRRLG